MGETSMTECLTTRLRFVRDHLAAADTTVQAFYDDGADFESVADKLDPLALESLANAWGYLQGAADMADLTVLELLETHGLTLDAPKAVRKRNPCPKCGGKSHRCKTALCRHCDVCEHMFFPGQPDASSASYRRYTKGS